MQTSFLIIFKIAISFTALFVLPFLLITFKIFHRQDKLFQIYISMIIGLFSSMALVYLLAVLGLFNKINFLASYSLIIVVFNVYFLRQIKQPKTSFKFRLTPGFFLLLFAFAIGAYMRLYEPLRHISLGSGDFYHHLQFLKQAAGGQVLEVYPRGYHIILALIYFVSNTDSYTIARFAGAFFGIISIGAVYCLMRDAFGKKAAIFTTLFYSGFTLFNYLTIEETGLFPQGFGFVLIPFVICFALKLVNNFKRGNIRKRDVLVFIFTVFLLSLMAPYVMLQMTYILGLILLFSLAFYGRIRRSFKRVAALIVLFSLGVGIVLSYYTTVAKFCNVRLTLLTYDEAEIVKSLETKDPLWKVLTESVKKVVTGSTKPADRIDTVTKIMAETTKATSFLDGKWEIIKSLLYIKRLRMPVAFPLSLGAYGGLLVSFFVLLFSMIKKRLELFTISAFTLLFGASCMTGILELPHYQGRSGWYFMLGSIWLGGIIAQRFYDQELVGDIFHALKRVNPLRIVNKGTNTKESGNSLIYFMVTLSGLVGYLIIIRVLGLIRLSPIRDVSLLALVPILIFAVGRKKRDILSGERMPVRLSGKVGLYLSLHKILVVVGILVVMLYPLPRAPEFNFRIYHRSENDDDFVEVVQKVRAEYPLSEVKMFFDSDILRSAARKTKDMVYPQNIEIVETQDILSGTGDKRYNFLFFDCRKEESESLKSVREWLSIYEQQHNNVRVFYDSEKIVVYLIEN